MTTSHKRQRLPTGGLLCLWRGGRITLEGLDHSVRVISRRALARPIRISGIAAVFACDG
jgi:hypothetical protein